MTPALTHGSRMMVVVGYEGVGGGNGGEKGGGGEEEEEEDGEAAGNTSCTHPRVNAPKCSKWQASKSTARS